MQNIDLTVVKWDSYLCDKNCYMTPERLTQKLPNSYHKIQKWIPYGYLKLKMDTKIATLLGSHLGAKREPNGSQNQNALLPFLNIINRVLAFFKKNN
ncbi:hypothetical protein [Staphylococcus epidermidis]|uniref:hypothetical protein n=1 Tax=Staphylococcus epidermidis TaxID=1282 RepID=UPI0031332A96